MHFLSLSYDLFFLSPVINEDALVERIIAGLNLRALDPLPDIEKVIRATSVIHIKNARGNAVAISPTLALTALHDVGQVGAIVSLTTTIGGHRLPGIVVYHEFVADLVDIAVVELTTKGDVFPDCVDVLYDGIKLCDPLCVVGLKTGLRDSVSKVVFRCDVNMIEGDDGGNSAMFQTNYASFEGLSGAGAVTRVVNGVTKVVGVHVASHDETVKHPEIGKSGKKRTFASAESVDLALTSIASNIHGHHAFCLACEVARVPDLVKFLHERGVR